MSTTRRTFNRTAENDFAVFRDGVKHALYAGLYAMAQRGCRVALLAFVSGGIYAGPWGKGFLPHFVCIVNEILTEPWRRWVRGRYTGVVPPLGAWFERVVLTPLEPPVEVV